MERRQRAGMSLVEVLVVLAVTGIVIMLLMPLVSRARAAARREECVNNLKQIGLALHNYLTATGVFPMSQVQGVGIADGHGTGHSVFALVLPYLEQAPVYNAYNFALENWHATNQTVAQARLAVFICPDNPDTEGTLASEVRFPESRALFAKGHYGANWGGGHGPWGEEFVKAKGTYQGVMMTVIAPDGMVKAADGKPRARVISLKDITDGTSNTLAMVEKRDSFGWAVGGWGGSEFDVYKTPAYEGDDPLAAKVYTGSPHEAGPNALFCDGAVRSLRAQQDQAAWFALLTRAGNERVE